MRISIKNSPFIHYSRYLRFWVLLLSGFLLSGQIRADHVAGTDLSWSCTSTPGVYKITFSFYRTCTGISVCGNSCGAPCSRTLQISGADPSCSSTSFGTLQVSLVGVRDANANPLCPTSKTICTNQGCIAAGSYTPAVERYDFEGNLNLGPSSGIPASCCNIRVSWQECCRSAEISTGSTWQNFYMDCIINRCAAANTPCNSSPVLTNDPFAILCGGQPFVFNNGAIDPDGDSLTYAFSPALTGPGVSVTYNAPYAYNMPMPHYPPSSGPFPLGIVCDPLFGDIMFTPQYGGTGQFVGVMSLEVKQWRTIGGVPTVVGITHRDIQMWIIACPPNNPPRMMTDPGIGNQPRLNWGVCAGNTLCFDVIAKDTDYYPFNNPPISDTTYLKWNAALASKGATFLPKYDISKRKLLGPREDIYQFCWTPTEAMAASLPYYFVVSGQDNRCPNTGKFSRAIAITVLGKADVTIKKSDYKCGKWGVSYVKNKPSQSFVSTIWNISTKPNDYTGLNVNTYLNLVNPPIQQFTTGGRYLVELIVNTPGPPGEPPCSKSFFDTLLVDTTVAPFVRDTFVCLGNSVTIPYSARWGKPPYSFRWFIPPDTFISPKNGPLFTLTYWTPPAPTVNMRYTLQVRDINGCRGYDSNIFITVKQLPVFTQLDTQRICAATSYTMDFGNNNNKAAKYLWTPGTAADTLRTLTRSDSGAYVLQITDSFNCKNKDTFRLYVNAPVLPDAGADTAICWGDEATLTASGGQLYQWRKLGASPTIIQAKGYNNTVKVKPTTSTFYEVTAYVSYPDTLSREVECSKTDTIFVKVNPLPVLTKPQSVQVCRSTTLATINPPADNQPGGTGSWSYTWAPGALVGGATTQVKVDSLRFLPNDTLNYSTLPSYGGFDNWIRYKYVAPALYGGCTQTDSAVVKVFGNPYVVAGSGVKWCKNAGVFKLQNDGFRSAPYTGWTPTPTDGTGQFGVWTGNGVNVININPSPNVRYEFDPKKPNVLTAPQKNILTYTYTAQYKFTGAPSCVSQDTVLFEVTPTPTLTVGTAIKICNNEPIIGISTTAGSSSSSGTAGFWTHVPVTPLNGVDQAVKDSQNFDPSKVNVSGTNTTWKLLYNDNSTGCLVRDTLAVTVVKMPTVDLKFDSLLCLNTGSKPSTISVSPTGGTTNIYSSNPVTSAYSNTGVLNTNDPSLTAGIYSLTYTYAVSISGKSCTNADTTQVRIQEPPKIVISTKDLKGCADTPSFYLSLASDPYPYTFTWKHFGNGKFENDEITRQQAVYLRDSVADVPGTVKITASTSKQNSWDPCPVARDSTTITISEVPLADFECTNCDGCEPLSPVLTAKPAGTPVTWQWLINGVQSSTQETFNLTLPNWGKFRAELKVMTAQGCGNTSKPQDIKVHSFPVAAFDPSPRFTTVVRPYFDFINKSYSADGAAISYMWNFGPEDVGGKERLSGDVNPKGIVFGGEPGLKLIKLKATTEFGCSDDITDMVRVDPDITVFIPNSFYPNSEYQCPNGDADCNRVFKPAASGFMTIEVFVFNRWGQQVWHVNDATTGWNGYVNNNTTTPPCEQGVYIYQINATSFSGKAYKYSGSITLLR